MAERLRALVFNAVIRVQIVLGKCLINSSVILVNSQLVCLRPVGILIMLIVYLNYLFLGI